MLHLYIEEGLAALDPADVGTPPAAVLPVSATTGEVGQCKLDPGLKAPWFQNLKLMKRKLAFNLSPVSELAPLQRGH